MNILETARERYLAHLASVRDQVKTQEDACVTELLIEPNAPGDSEPGFRIRRHDVVAKSGDKHRLVEAAIDPTLVNERLCSSPKFFRVLAVKLLE